MYDYYFNNVIMKNFKDDTHKKPKIKIKLILKIYGLVYEAWTLPMRVFWCHA